MSLPCHECPVLPICLSKFNRQVVICDIVWKYVVLETNYVYLKISFPNFEREKRVNEAKNLFHNESFAPEDESDLL